MDLEPDINVVRREFGTTLDCLMRFVCLPRTEEEYEDLMTDLSECECPAQVKQYTGHIPAKPAQQGFHCLIEMMATHLVEAVTEALYDATFDTNIHRK